MIAHPAHLGPREDGDQGPVGYDGVAMSEVSISVIVPTFERVGLLQRCLGGLLRQTLRGSRYEVIVVDNGSTDGTAVMVERLARARRSREPVSLRYVLEPRRGVSYAKNAGLQAARGAIIAYLDDDAIPGPQWAETIVRDFERVDPFPHVVGGPAYPLFTGRRPAWYRDAYETATWGDEPRFLERHEFFFGLNVAFRRDMLEAVGGFDPDLGMKGPYLVFGEDEEVFERLWKAADERLAAYYDPETSVRHLIPDARLDPLYRVKRGFISGHNRHALDRGRLLAGAREASGGSKRWWWAPGKLLRICRGLAARTDTHRHLGNVLIEVGVPVAERLGYAAALLGARVKARRSH